MPAGNCCGAGPALSSTPHTVTLVPGIEQIEGFFPTGVVALQTTRAGGVSLRPFDGFNLGSHVGDAPEAVAANRARLVSYLPSTPVWLSQVHGTAAVNHDQPALKQQTADACYTGQANRVCAVMTADCLPVMIAREDGQQVGLAHAGWRGLCAGVIESTLSQMLVTDPQGVRQTWSFWLGPAIGPGAFEVGDEVRRAFVKAWARADQAFVPSRVADGRWLADLGMLAQQRIERFADQHALCGLRIGRHTDCTLEMPQKYFSYRRDGQTGRMATLIYFQSI